jgi:hypothetical protein
MVVFVDVIDCSYVMHVCVCVMFELCYTGCTRMFANFHWTYSHNNRLVGEFYINLATHLRLQLKMGTTNHKNIS